ncbi:transglycosylase family protein [Streptomyces sp. NBC_01775]|uniref:transglycosylase family protein n=1 Tax=Streptomyces sp. NBC_01775 TaxID=2975939 RepID=UPI002DD9D21A|nr:transglycosylase family protein [Streptomyces sp. NBC_01775]WSB78690.1 transglycosylase family protein [Streptomyces sp. NBC_01775]
MRSGNGRHRRPRQAPALFVAAGVTGAGIAIPLLGATGAHAADATVWDKVAQCESVGVWNAKGAGGHYGGLQLTQEMWKKYGGTAYAERPDLASRSQQIAVGEEILAAQGVEAFSDCGESAGLGDAKGDPDVDPGDEPGSGRSGGYPAPAPSPSDDQSDDDSSDKGDDDSAGKGSSDREDSPSKKPGDAPSDKLPSDPSEGPVKPENPDEAPKPSDSAKPSEPGKGKHRGEPGDRAPHGERPSDGERPSRGGDRERGTTAKHRVQPGDSLSQIAADEDVRGGWPELYERNKDEVGTNPDLIHPGQDLRL